MDKIKIFCDTLDFDEFKKLPCIVKQKFLEASKEVLSRKKGFLGLAYIIRNIMDPPKYKQIKYMFGTRGVKLMKSEKYGMEVCILDDSHTFKYKCDEWDGKEVIASASRFIVEQVRSAEDFVDLYLEVPYIKKGEKLKGIGNTYMRNTHIALIECFKWTKEYCQYPHLRAHYIDTRSPYFTEDISMIYKLIKSRFYEVAQPLNINLSILNNKVYEKIFRDKESLVSYSRNFLSRMKFYKQMTNIEDEELKKVIIKHVTEWIQRPTDSNINFKYLKWDYIKNALLRNDREQIRHVFFSLSSYLGFMMDAYTVSRIFRKYRRMPNKYSGRARKLIIYAGGFHTNRYINLFTKLGFTINYSKKGKNLPRGKRVFEGYKCTDIRDMKQPIFNR